MRQQVSDYKKIFKWVGKTTIVNVLLVVLCFLIILSGMILTYEGGEDVSEAIIGEWNCVQFYKNQKSFQVPKSQNITVTITSSGQVTLVGSDNASVFRGSTRQGTYTVEGGSTLLIDMGGETWTCQCVFTTDGLLRMTISEVEMILYLEKSR